VSGTAPSLEVKLSRFFPSALALGIEQQSNVAEFSQFFFDVLGVPPTVGLILVPSQQFDASVGLETNTLTANALARSKPPVRSETVSTRPTMLWVGLKKAHFEVIILINPLFKTLTALLSIGYSLALYQSL